MSLLAKQTVTPEVRLDREAAQIKTAPRRLIEMMLREWEPSFNLMWTTKDGVTPAMRLAEIGTDAVELFANNTAFATFLIANLTDKDNELVARITAKLATIPAYTEHQNGTITLD